MKKNKRKCNNLFVVICAFIILSWIVLVCLFLMKVFRTDIQSLYKENWNIEIPNPNKVISIIEQISQDPASMNILYYSKEDIDIIKNQNYFKQINENKAEFERKYNVYVKNYFLKNLTESEIQLFNENINEDELLNKQNYYAILEKRNTYYPIFEFLIIDIENNAIYTMHFTN